MNHAFNSIEGSIPRVVIEEISLSEFEIFFGMGKFVEESILGLVGKRPDSSDDFVASLEKLPNDMRGDVT